MPERQPRLPLRRILPGALVGAIIGHAVSIPTVFAIAGTVGHMDYEMSGMVGLFFGTVGAIPAGMIGIAVAVAQAPRAKAMRLLVATIFGGLCSGAVYSIIVVPLATVPAVVVFWTGVVPLVSGMAAGAVGGLMGIQSRRAA
jgi:hypothetical protein